MNGILDGGTFDPCLDAARLRAQPAADLWRMWKRVGYALLERAGSAALRSIANVGHEWVLRLRQRSLDAYLLQRLTEHELRDMGLTRQQAMFEVNKPFWRR